MRYLLAVVWALLAVSFVLRDGTEAVGHARSPVDPSQIDPGAVRGTLSDPPHVEIGGVMQKCSDCHALFASLEVTPSEVLQHTHIAMDHGLNGRCFNCHDQEDRNTLRLQDGTRLGFDRSSELCASCHGTLYRDWERGMHGRTTGSWDRTSPEHDRLSCVECHDPHAPAFGPIELLPGPERPAGEAHDDGHAGPDEAQLANPLERGKTRLPGADHEEASDE